MNQRQGSLQEMLEQMTEELKSMEQDEKDKFKQGLQKAFDKRAKEVRKEKEQQLGQNPNLLSQPMPGSPAASATGLMCVLSNCPGQNGRCPLV